MSIKSQPNLPVYDIDEFKDLIRKLKTRKNELIIESTNVNNQIQEISATYESATKELNILNVADEIRNETSDVANPNNSLILDKKFIEENKKLEISILNHEIKSVLPKLEQEAMIWEQKMHDIEKETLKTQEQMSQMPDQYTKTTAELEQIYSELIEEKAKLAGK